MKVAFYFAGEKTQVLDAIPWVRCASGNVLIQIQIYRASQKKVGFRICNSPVVWDDQRLTKLTDTAQQLPPPPATKNLEFPKRNRTSNFGFWPAPKILYAVRMSLRRYPKFYIFTFWHFLAVFGQNKIGHSKSS